LIHDENFPKVGRKEKAAPNDAAFLNRPLFFLCLIRLKIIANTGPKIDSYQGNQDSSYC
jgi:hypothetical protein